MSNVKEDERNEAGFRAQHKYGPPEQPAENNAAVIEESIFQKIAADIGKLVTEKNIAYGSAHIVSGKIMLLLFPEGIHPHRIYDALLMVRIIDKLMRLATRPNAFGESPYKDIAGYGILGINVDAARPKADGKQPTTPEIGEKV